MAGNNSNTVKELEKPNAPQSILFIDDVERKIVVVYNTSVDIVTLYLEPAKCMCVCVSTEYLYIISKRETKKSHTKNSN